MFIILPNTVVRELSLGMETLDSVFSVLACGVRIEFRVPAAFLGQSSRSRF
jgi:hypothetical protein